VTEFVGLTNADVNHRIAIGATNEVHTTTSRTLGEIFRAHVFTRFNAVLGILLLVVLVANSPGDGLFGFVLLTNSTIGVLQEWSAKRKLDALALLHSQTSCVIRNGEETRIPTRDIVIDEFIVLRAGDQVPADGYVVASQNLEINESNLTGESDAIHKSIDNNVLSGTVVTAGHGVIVATSVGATAYAHRLASEARVFTRVSSEIQSSITRVLTWVTWLLVAVTPLQIWSHFRKVSEDGWQDHVVRISAGLVGLVPEGLVLLTTLAFLSAALSLSRQNVLVQELPAVETLARVDVVCLDKTGTLTSGNMVCEGIEVIGQPFHDTDIPFALAALANDQAANTTLLAIQRRFLEVPEWTHNGSIPFDSTRKWKADAFVGHGTWFLGAPEMLWDIDDHITKRVTNLASAGCRVMMLCYSPLTITTPQLPIDLVPMALVVLKEEIRDDAATTLRYFAEQKVRTIVISGDNPQTVQSIAHAVGIAGDAIDARQLGNSADLTDAAISHHSIFGRVTPEQKRTMVTVLQSQGHVVAMTGDGVNDALALKRADIGIAMDNGAPATKAVAQIVLLDGKFSHLPHVLAEGRRVIGNVERVANLFLAKNAMSLLAILASVAAGVTFPILPRQMTLLSTVTIGLPAFALALGENTIRYQPGFLRRIVSFSWPAGAIAGASVVVADAWTNDASGTAATLTALLTFFGILTFKSRPLSSWRLLLLLGMTLLAASAFIIPALSDFFAFTIKSEIVWKSVVTSLPLLLYIVTRMRKDSQEVF
jgi:cation-transporting ATPase E